MKLLPLLQFCACALCCVPSLAQADEPALDWAQRRVETGLLKPLAQRERGSRFSRERPPPRERRARITQQKLSVDKKGRAFVSFAVDVRFGGEWRENDIVGCVYRGSGELYVQRGDEYRPAVFVLGKNVASVSGVCVADPAASARS